MYELNRLHIVPRKTKLRVHRTKHKKMNIHKLGLFRVFAYQVKYLNNALESVN